MKDDGVSEKSCLDFHKSPRPGKIEMQLTKKIDSWRGLSLSYSPGVAHPCIQIVKDPLNVYEYTNRGNSVAVISNGTSVLGLGNLGALASKPVMEGKAALFKKFSGIDAIDIEIDSQNQEDVIRCVQLMGNSFGGINLEDIKSPECFLIEDALIKALDIPVFHDDQHGTAIVVLAGVLNAIEIQKKSIETIKVFCVGGGAAAIACLKLLQEVGVPNQNIFLSDKEGVVHSERTDLNSWKSLFAQNTSCRTIVDAAKDADVLIGLSVAGAIPSQVIDVLAQRPVIFVMSNPVPEIFPEEIRKHCENALIATGRSDYSNQINNLLSFPYIFRGALDVRSSQINIPMKIAAAKAIAAIAKLPFLKEMEEVSGIKNVSFGAEYFIPSAFDPRLFVEVSYAVARTAIETGVARISNFSLPEYKQRLQRGVQNFWDV